MARKPQILKSPFKPQILKLPFKLQILIHHVFKFKIVVIFISSVEHTANK